MGVDLGYGRAPIVGKTEEELVQPAAIDRLAEWRGSVERMHDIHDPPGF